MHQPSGTVNKRLAGKYHMDVGKQNEAMRQNEPVKKSTPITSPKGQKAAEKMTYRPVRTPYQRAEQQL
jgi:hypothetical protein